MSTKTKPRKIKQLADRFGSNRENAHRPGELLKGCTCIAIPFAGGMCEVPYMESNIVLVNDLDRHVVNLARVVREFTQERLAAKLDCTPFHPDVLREAQAFCRRMEALPDDEKPGRGSDFGFEWAYHYFISAWMVRGGSMGTDGEFDQALSIRWKSGGGDSVVRFRNATEALKEWQKTMQRCTFTTLDAFEFIGQCKKRDIPENGIYCDAPWPKDGDAYTHKFPEPMQRRLSKVLGEFERTKIVVRYGDHPLIRELYKEPKWTWNLVTGRTQANDAKAEVLLTNWRP